MRVPEEIELDSGVVIVIKPVTFKLYQALCEKFERHRPRPQPPLVEVRYKGEEPTFQPNRDDPDFAAKEEEWTRAQWTYLMNYFMENAVQVDVPRSWRGEELREAEVYVPRPRSWPERMLGLRKKAEKTRARLYLDFVAFQSPEDHTRLTRGILSAAGLYTEDMTGEAEDSFRGDGGRAAPEKMGDESQRGPRIIDLHRAESGGEMPLQPDGVGGTDGTGEGAGGSLLSDGHEAGGRRFRERGAQGAYAGQDGA